MGQKSENAAGRSAFALQGSLSHQLHIAQQMASDYFAEKMGPIGMTLRQFAVLAAISEKPGRSQSDLVTATGVDRSTLADMVARLEKRGWIMRESHVNDGRAWSVSLTPVGRSVFTDAVPHAIEADEIVLKVLRSKRDRKHFEAALARFAEAAKPSKAERKKLKAQEKAARAALKPDKVKAPDAEKSADAKKKAKRR